jgi:hypothetical protein
LLVATACTLGSGVAGAEPFHEDPPDEAANAAPRRERWYGWQTLSVDAVPAGLFAGAFATDDTAFFIGGAAAFVLGGPLVHVLHERPLTGLGSFGLRVALPALGMALGAPFADLDPAPDMPGMTEEDSNGPKPIFIGGVVGAAAASALDAGLLAYETSPESAAKRGTLRAQPLGLSLALTPRGGRVTVLGAF